MAVCWLISILQPAQMGDLEELPAGTYASIARYPWTLVHIDIRYDILFAVFTPMLHTLIRGGEC